MKTPKEAFWRLLLSQKVNHESGVFKNKLAIREKGEEISIWWTVEPFSN